MPPAVSLQLKAACRGQHGVCGALLLQRAADASAAADGSPGAAVTSLSVVDGMTSYHRLRPAMLPMSEDQR